MITVVKYHVRRIAALLILFLLVRAGFKALPHDEPSDHPAPEQETSVSAEPRRQAAASITQGRPVEMVVPVLGLRAGFEGADCRVVDGKIDPKSMDKACAHALSMLFGSILPSTTRQSAPSNPARSPSTGTTISTGRPCVIEAAACRRGSADTDVSCSGAGWSEGSS